MLVDVSHVIEDGMITYKGLPAPYSGPHCLDQKMAILRYCFVQTSWPGSRILACCLLDLACSSTLR
jgi:hypothetical protein